MATTDTKPQTRGTTPVRQSDASKGSASSQTAPQGASGGGVNQPTEEKKKRVNRDPLHPFQGEIMQKVIKPKIAELIASGEGMDDVALHFRFKKETGSCVALNRFRNWMKACGFVQAWIANG